VRLRPLLEDTEKAHTKKRQTDKRAWNISKSGANDTLTQKGHARKREGQTVFHFDQVFDEDTQTPLLYKSMARQMVKSVLDGKHATIFAYGQTGSGKTWTMQGDGKKQSGQAGIIQLVVSDLFRFMRQGQAMKRNFTVKASYVEIYNERIRDLLSDDVGSTASHGTPTSINPAPGNGPEKGVTIRATGTGEVVLNCIQTEVTSVDEALELLIAGNTQRVVAKTDMNSHSSRSHAIFRLTVESREKSEAMSEVFRVSDFNLVDLAGSEGVKVSNTTGVRQREGAKINQR
jgi:kinesin family protein 11